MIRSIFPAKKKSHILLTVVRDDQIKATLAKRKLGFSEAPVNLHSTDKVVVMDSGSLSESELAQLSTWLRFTGFLYSVDQFKKGLQRNHTDKHK